MKKLKKKMAIAGIGMAVIALVVGIAFAHQSTKTANNIETKEISLDSCAEMHNSMHPDEQLTAEEMQEMMHSTENMHKGMQMGMIGSMMG